MEFSGARDMHVNVPCPLGWGTPTSDTIKVARMAVECALFPIVEAEYGEIIGRRELRQRIPVDDYLRTQSRFAHLFSSRHPGGRDEARIAQMQAIADLNIARFGLMSARTAEKVNA